MSFSNSPFIASSPYPARKSDSVIGGGEHLVEMLLILHVRQTLNLHMRSYRSVPRKRFPQWQADGLQGSGLLYRSEDRVRARASLRWSNERLTVLLLNRCDHYRAGCKCCMSDES
jgi:hypothetical protein